MAFCQVSKERATLGSVTLREPAYSTLHWSNMNLKEIFGSIEEYNMKRNKPMFAV
jgi:hypothetical protein